MKRLVGFAPVLLLSLGVVVGAIVGLNLAHDSNNDMEFVGLTSAVSLTAAGGMHPGDVLGFAMPQMRNDSAWPMRIDGFGMDHVPSGARLVGFRLLSDNDTGSVLLGSFPVNHRCSDISAPGYDCYPDYLPKHPVIGPGHVSNLYPVVYLKLLHPTTDAAYGCEYWYTVQGVQHEQPAQYLFFMQPDQ